MSYITNVLVQGARQEQIDALNEWLSEHDDRQQRFEKIDMDAAGGTKYYVADVWAAAFNYMPIDLLAKLRDPETWHPRTLLVAVVIDGEETIETFCFDYADTTAEERFAPVMAQGFRA